MIVILLLIVCGSLFATTPPAEFAEHVIDLTGGSQAVIADLNKDGKPDIIAIAGGEKELVWFENPAWQRHVLASELSGMTNVAAWDIDGDGIPELVLAHEFAADPKSSLGILSVLKHGVDPRQPWKITEIDRIPTSHLLRWADLKGDGRRTLVNAPLSGITPGKTPLVSYKPGAWIRETISEENEGPVHGMNIAKWDAESAEAILTAGVGGIHLFRLGLEGECLRTEITKIGSTDVAAGSLGRREERIPFLAALDPTPTTQISVYRPEGKIPWKRQVIVDSLVPGGTILTADLNADRNDEIISGGYIFYALNAKGDRWSKSVLDSDGAGAANCVVADLNADGKTDIVCIGAASLKWYENRGVRK